MKNGTLHYVLCRFSFFIHKMLKEDYIMRLFQLFSESLAKWLSKRKTDNSDLVVSFNNEVVKPYLGNDIQFFESKSKEELIEYFSQLYPNKPERLSRLEILTEVLYQRAWLEENDQKGKNLFNITLELLLYINSIDRTYSMERENRISELQNQ